MRIDGLTDQQARFAIGDRHSRRDSDTAALVGAVKSFVASIFAHSVRNGSENPFTKIMQDMTLDNVIDFMIDKNKDKSNNTNNEKP